MKEAFELPEVTIITLEQDDIITTSDPYEGELDY